MKVANSLNIGSVNSVPSIARIVDELCVVTSRSNLVRSFQVPADGSSIVKLHELRFTSPQYPYTNHRGVWAGGACARISDTHFIIASNQKTGSQTSPFATYINKVSIQPDGTMARSGYDRIETVSGFPEKHAMCVINSPIVAQTHTNYQFGYLYTRSSTNQISGASYTVNYFSRVYPSCISTGIVAVGGTLDYVWMYGVTEPVGKMFTFRVSGAGALTLADAVPLYWGPDPPWTTPRTTMFVPTAVAHISGTTYVFAANSSGVGTNTGAWLTTITINADGTIDRDPSYDAPARIDSLQYYRNNVGKTQIHHIRDEEYAIVHGRQIDTVTIHNDGTFGSITDTFYFDSIASSYPDVVAMSEATWAVMYNSNGTGWLKTIDIFAAASAASAASAMSFRVGLRPIAVNASGGVPPVIPGPYGWFGGGYNSPYVIDRISLSFDTVNAIDRCNLSVPRGSLAGFSDATYGWFGGGILVTAPADIIDRITLADDTTNAIDRCSLSQARLDLTGFANGTYGWFGGGWDNVNFSNVVDRIILADDIVNAIDRCDLSQARRWLAAFADNVHGWFGGGAIGSPTIPVKTIDRITLATDAVNAIYRCDLSLARSSIAAFADNVHGWFGGGWLLDTIDRITLATDTVNAIDRCDLTVARYALAAFADNVHGWFGGGYAPPTGYLDTVDRITLATDTVNAIDRCDLTIARHTLAAFD